MKKMFCAKASMYEIEETCNKYNFWDKKVMPYGFGITIRELFNGWKDYDNCTEDSKNVIRAEIKGLLPIINKWVEYEEEPMIDIMYIIGTKKGERDKVHKSLAENMIDAEFAIAIN